MARLWLWLVLAEGVAVVTTGALNIVCGCGQMKVVVDKELLAGQSVASG